MTSMANGTSIRGILLDIEGTTTPISFVHEVLFPYARTHVKDYLDANFDSAETVSQLERLREEHARDVQQGQKPPALVSGPLDAAIDSVVAYVHWLIERDRKSPGLKSLQGRIWEQGYLDGSLTAPLFPDVLSALKTARSVGLKVAIFSSGSIFAQKLLFAHTDAGDISQLIDGYFDTITGPKTASESYRQIALALGLAPNEVIFISDVIAELDAARSVGMQTRLCVRPGNQPQPAGRHEVIKSLDQLADII